MDNLLKTSSIDTVADFIESRRSGLPQAISIWGPSGSGKTYLADAVSAILPDSRVIHIDDYLSEETIAGPRHPIGQSITHIEGVNPNIWNQARLNSDLKHALGGVALSVPQFDRKNRVQLSCDKTLEAATITLIEGAYAYENDIKDDLSALAIVSSSLHSRFTRKLARTINKTGRTDVDESIQRYLQQTQGSLAFTWDRHLKHANIVFENDPLPNAILHRDTVTTSEASFSARAVSLLPKSGYGRLGDNEEFVVDSNKGRTLRLVHLIGDKVLLNCSISGESYAEIREYYDEV